MTPSPISRRPAGAREAVVHPPVMSLRHVTGRRRILAAPAVLALTLAGCSRGPEASRSSDGVPDAAETAPLGEPTVIASGLEAPWSITFHDTTALVSERDSGRILEVLDGGETREAGRIDGLRTGGEAGLLGLAVREAHLYAYYATDADNRIVRLPITGTPGALALGTPETILDGIPTADHHDGGRLAFGPDGMLYATAGDATDPGSAQDPESLSGKILRMTPEGAVPQDNPFPGSLVYTLGHRNPQGIAWDDEGTMYASEFGQETWDELNVIEAGGNYGWPEVEGAVGREEFIDPVQHWEPSEASPSGIAVAGDRIYIANLRGQRLREVPLADTSTAGEQLVREDGRLRDVVRAPDGSIWVLTNTTDGRGDPGPDDDRILCFEV